LVDGCVEEVEDYEEVGEETGPECVNDCLMGTVNTIENEDDGGGQYERDELIMEDLEVHLRYPIGTFVTEQMITLLISREERIPKLTRITPVYFS
jgi:hypothetical protein